MAKITRFPDVSGKLRKPQMGKKGRLARFPDIANLAACEVVDKAKTTKAELTEVKLKLSELAQRSETKGHKPIKAIIKRNANGSLSLEVEFDDTFLKYHTVIHT